MVRDEEGVGELTFQMKEARQAVAGRAEKGGWLGDLDSNQD